MTNKRIAVVFFGLGLLLLLSSMVTGPFGLDTISITASMLTCVCGVFGAIFAYRSWDDPEDEEYGDFEIRWQEDPPSPEPPEKEVPAAVPYEYTARIELSEVLVKLNLCISIVEALALAVLILG